MICGLGDIQTQLYVQTQRRSEFIQRMARDGSVSGFESEVYRRDGTTLWISETAREIRSESGRLLRYEGTVEDITERKQAEESLRESETRYRSLVEHSPEAVVVYSDNRIVYANGAAASLFAAANASELLGRLIFDFVHPITMR